MNKTNSQKILLLAFLLILTATGYSETTHWQSIDTGAFSVSVPNDFKFARLEQKPDYWVGGLANKKIKLIFQFGKLPHPFKQDYDSSHYEVRHEIIDGHQATITFAKNGFAAGETGIYIENVGGGNQFQMAGWSLNESQQGMVYQIFRSLKFNRK